MSSLRREEQEEEALRGTSSPAPGPRELGGGAALLPCTGTQKPKVENINSRCTASPAARGRACSWGSPRAGPQPTPAHSKGTELVPQEHSSAPQPYPTSILSGVSLTHSQHSPVLGGGQQAWGQPFDLEAVTPRAPASPSSQPSWDRTVLRDVGVPDF